MFKLTEKAKKFKKFIIHANSVSVTDYSEYENEQAIWESVKSESWVSEEVDNGMTIDFVEKLFVSSLAVFTAAELIEAAQSGYGWPAQLGLVEIIEQESTMNTTAPAQYINFNWNKLSFWLSNEPQYRVVPNDGAVTMIEGGVDEIAGSWSASSEAIFELPGNPDEYRYPYMADVMEALLNAPVGEEVVLKVREVEFYVPEVFEKSTLETKVSVVAGRIQPGVWVTLADGQWLWKCDFSIKEEYHHAIEREVEKFFKWKSYLSEVEITLTSKDVASYILQNGGATYAGYGIGWILGKVKVERAQQVVERWNNEQQPEGDFEIEVFAYLKELLS